VRDSEAYDTPAKEKNMSFLNVLKTVSQIGGIVGPSVATAINPGAGAIISLIVTAVAQAEEAGGTGSAKKAAVVASVLPTATTILSASLQARGGKTQIDPGQLSTAIGKIVDGVVDLMNSVQATTATGAGGTASAGSTKPTPKA
jgi:hypothetical protein